MVSFVTPREVKLCCPDRQGSRPCLWARCARSRWHHPSGRHKLFHAELIFIQKGLKLLLPRLAKVISNLSQFALKYKDMPTLAYTHYQAAQPHTVGKRAAQWTQDLLLDLRNLTRALEDLEFRSMPCNSLGGVLPFFYRPPASN